MPTPLVRLRTAPDPVRPSNLPGHPPAEVERIVTSKRARANELTAAIAAEHARMSRPVSFDDPYAPVGSREGLVAWHAREGVRPRWNPDLDETMPSLRNSPEPFRPFRR